MRKAGAFVLALCGFWSVWCSAGVVDNFDSYIPGQIDSVTADWYGITAAPSVSVVETDPADSGNQVLRVVSTSGIRGASGQLRDNSIEDNTTKTLFLRFRASNAATDHTLGLTDVDIPDTNWNNYRVQVGIYNGTLRVRHGSNNLTTVTLNTGWSQPWYNLWLVVDNVTDTFKVYLHQSGNADATETNRITSGLIDTFSFRFSTTRALERFLWLAQTGDQRVWVDDIYMMDGVNLVNPVKYYAKNSYPQTGSLNVDNNIILSWAAPADTVNPTYNVYLGTNAEDLGLVSLGQSSTSFTPTLTEGMQYYWRVDTVAGSVVYTGTLWRFSTLLASASNYFMDGQNGSDSNDGRSSATPWQTLGKINGITLLPGDRVLFNTGSTYTGQFRPQGSGVEGSPIIIDMYGSGVKRPKFDGQGTVNPTLYLRSIEYYEVNNLEITNTGSSASAGRKGVGIDAWNYWAHDHIYLRNLYIHDVNGSNVKADGGGYGIYIFSTGSVSHYTDLRIENCHLVRTDRNGIGFWTEYCYPWWNWNPSFNVLIRGNILEDIGGDGIVPVGCDGAVVEYNLVRGARQRATDYAAGIWPWGCKNTLIQFNEVSGMKGTNDGQAFDADYECGGTVIQYNYSHDNEGGFLLVCSPGTSDYAVRDTIVRYNISERDGSSARIIQISGKTINTRIYNNVVYSNKTNTMILFSNWDGGVPSNTYFYNNIFYVVSGYTASYTMGSATGTVFSNNVFYGTHSGRPSDSAVLTSNPQFVSAGAGITGFDSLSGYVLQPGSPCLDSGMRVSNSGGRDFWNNPIETTHNTDRGTYEKTPFKICSDYLSSDMTGDCRITLSDYAVMAQHWLDSGCGTCGGADLSGDQNVNISDLIILAADWLRAYPLDGLQAYWRMDNTDGKNVQDVSGNAHHGQLQNSSGTWVSSRAGQGNALQLDGVDDYVIIPDYSGIGGTGARTVSLWVKTSASGVYQALVQWGSDTTGQLWLLRVETDGTVLAAAYGGGVHSSQSVANGQWHHIAAVLDEGQTDSRQIRLYVDSILDTAATGSCIINTSQAVPMHLGVWYQYSTGTRINYFQGQLDEVRIYDRALTGAEIIELAR